MYYTKAIHDRLCCTILCFPGALPAGARSKLAEKIEKPVCKKRKELITRK